MAPRFRTDRDASAAGKNRAKANAEKHFGKKTAKKEDEKPRVLPDLLAADVGPKARDFDHHYKTALGLKAKCDEANGRYRDALKKAKEAGINPAVITATMGWAKKDPMEAQQYFKQLRATFETAGIEVQLAMFDEPSVSRSAQIYDDGFKAGKTAKSSTDNPHDLNTSAGQTWMQGWSAGQAENIAGIKQTPAKDSLGAVPGAAH